MNVRSEIFLQCFSEVLVLAPRVVFHFQCVLMALLHSSQVSSCALKCARDVTAKEFHGGWMVLVGESFNGF